MIPAEKLEILHDRVMELYKGRNTDIPFHGWHHVVFVVRKTASFAHELGAVESVAVAAAYTHDLNYLVDRRNVAALGGSELRQKILREIGLSADIVGRIESIVLEAETATRDADISLEAQALSDADTLFKALPITPVVLAPLYMQETGFTLRRLAKKITSEQVPLRDQEIYFYSPSAREKYGYWADVNLRLWENLMASLDDADVVELLSELGMKA